uniref:Uncharacterized protein n=1 Tax=Candidatus Methanophaga sp. ANME-1 ERB7 TaxID=2759913 RepID=A0A7G9Z6K2_9EURY|nr:hypothetical protein FMLIDMBJ_00034 [Methanosarcinales archaeon ANME-1 ERB7]
MKPIHLRRHIPIIISIIIFIGGIITWFFKAVHLARSLVWIPETSDWQKISICLIDTYYIPIYFIVASIILYILL